jgi:ABC-type antimicrobial peptide transport system permease subunit
VLNVITTVILEQRRQIGILKSIGATLPDTFLMYAGIALVYGLIGVVPGVLLGVPTGYLASAQVTPQFNILLGGFTVAWRAVLIGTLLGVLMPILAAAPPILAGIRVTILEAITDMGIHATYGHGVMVRLIDLVPLPVSLRQALRNVSQKKARLALTIVALALAAGAFMGVYAAFSSFNTILDSVMSQIGIHITVGPGDKNQIDTVRELIQDNISGLKAIEPGLSLAIDIEGYTPHPVGPGPAFTIASGLNPANPDVVKFRLRSGTAWQDDPNRHGVVIAAPIADGLHRDVGDSITVHAGGKVATFEIIGVADYLFETVWIRWEDLAQLAGLTKGTPTPNRYLTTLQVDGEATAALGVNEQARLVLPFTAGGFYTAGQPGVMISAALAEQRGYRVGDTLALTSGSNSLPAPVTGIFTIPAQFAQASPTEDVIALDWETLAALEGQSLTGDPIPGGLQIVMEQKNPTAQQVSNKIDEINNLLLTHGINANYTNWISSVEGITEMIRTAQLVLNIASLMIAAVGAIGLLSSLSMSVFERQKEIGVMRSVGGTSTTIAFQFLVEGVIVGIIAWALGVPISYALDRNLITQFNFQHAAEAQYPPLTLVLGLVSTLIIAAFASLWPSLAAARKTVSDILRYQ